MRLRKLGMIVGGLLLGTTASASVCVGTCDVLGADGVVTAPPGGDTYRYVSTQNGPDGGGDIPGAMIAEATNGSSYTTDSFTAAAGDTLVFYFNYITSDGAGFSDFGWAALSGAADIILFTARTTPSGDTVPGFGLPGLAAGVVLTPSSTPIIAGGPVWSPLGSYSGACFSDGCGYTGWIQSTYTILTAGTYALSFGAANSVDTQFDSGLAFAGLTIADKPIDPTEPPSTSVPEPGTLALLGLGIAGLGWSRRRKTA